jgi:hypothetical protein
MEPLGVGRGGAPRGGGRGYCWGGWTGGWGRVQGSRWGRAQGRGLATRRGGPPSRSVTPARERSEDRGTSGHEDES